MILAAKFYLLSACKNRPLGAVFLSQMGAAEKYTPAVAHICGTCLRHGGIKSILRHVSWRSFKFEKIENQAESCL